MTFNQYEIVIRQTEEKIKNIEFLKTILEQNNLLFLNDYSLQSIHDNINYLIKYFC